MDDHAGLRQGESHEGADGVERDEAVGDAAEERQQRRGEGDKNVNTPRIEEAAATQHEDMGEIAFEGDGAGEAGEVGEGGIGGEGEDEEDAGDGDVIEPSAAHDGGGELG